MNVSHTMAEYRQQADHAVDMFEADERPERVERHREAIALLLTRQYDRDLAAAREFVMQLHNALSRKERENRSLQDALARLQDTVATLTSELARRGTT